MKQCLAKIACGFAAASLALALAACDDSSSASNVNGPENEEEISSESNGGDNPEFSSDSGNGSENIESSDAAGNSSNGAGESSASNENSSASLGGNSSANPSEESSSSQAVNSSNSQQTCAHITDAEGEGADKWKCSEPEFTIAQDCENQTYYMCVENRWIIMENCDPTQEKCGFDNYALCRATRSKTFCVDATWVNEPCDPEVHGYERTLYTYDEPDNPKNTSFTQMRYFCENGVWVSERDVYNCKPMMDCNGMAF
jgi:hypothetical protein